jgi:hypothetical protein
MGGFAGDSDAMKDNLAKRGRKAVAMSESEKQSMLGSRIKNAGRKNSRYANLGGLEANLRKQGYNIVDMTSSEKSEYEPDMFSKRAKALKSGSIKLLPGTTSLGGSVNNL